MATLAERLWRKVEVKGPDECWPWKGATIPQGYGKIRVQGGRLEYVHRVACELAHGPAPEDKPFALHARHCNNPACCNGAHLRWGTPKENSADMVAAGRHSNQFKSKVNKSC